MISFPELLSGIEIPISLLIFVGLGAGVLSGFAGVGGAFVVTPALIILGFPANFAVGTSLAWVMGKSVVAALIHGKLGNVNVRLGVVLIVAVISGVEVGVRILNWARNIGLAEEVVLALTICLLLAVGGYMLAEGITTKRQLDKMLEKKEKLPSSMTGTSFSRRLQSISLPPMLHLAKAQVTISLWIILFIGFFVGMLSGLIGVGGGFIMVPSLVYLVGIPSFMAVGTDLFQIVFSAAYGTIRHTMSGNVIILPAFIMVIASSIGVQFGALATRHVRGVSVRLILAISILLFAVGSTLKLISILLKETVTWPQTGSLAVTFGSLGLTVVMILALFIVSLRCRAGQKIPLWCQSLVIRGDE